MVKITQADIEAVTDEEAIALADEIVLNCHGNGNASVLIDRYRAEVERQTVERIVAWLRALWRDQVTIIEVLDYADSIEAGEWKQ